MEKTIGKLVIVDDFLLQLNKGTTKVNDFLKLKSTLRYEQSYSVCTRYGLTMHTLFGQLVEELGTHLDSAHYQKTIQIIKSFYNEEHFQKAEHYLTEMLVFIQERYAKQVDESSPLLLPPIVKALKMRTENPSYFKKIFYIIGLMQIQCDLVLIIAFLIDHLGYKYYIDWQTRHSYYTKYIPVVKDYLLKIQEAVSLDLVKENNIQQWQIDEAKNDLIEYTNLICIVK